jgi:predicted deacylase
MNQAIAQFEIGPRDLTPYRAGTHGVAYVHTFDSGRAGPHVLVNALSKGNELCGMAAVARLLDLGLQPARGLLTLSFANVAAYESFDPRRPDASKFLDVNFNRIWKREILDGGDSNREIERARAMRPVVETADCLLDLLSNCHLRPATPWNDPPLLSYIDKPSARDIAHRMSIPEHHIACAPMGGLLYEFGRFGDANSPAVGMLAECGPHFAQEAAEVAASTTLGFLVACGTIDEAMALRFGYRASARPIRRYTDMLVPVAATGRFRWVRRFLGHEVLGHGELIATDGEAELRAPYDNCVLIAVADPVGKGEGACHLVRRVS